MADFNGELNTNFNNIIISITSFTGTTPTASYYGEKNYTFNEDLLVEDEYKTTDATIKFTGQLYPFTGGKTRYGYL